MAVPLVMGVAVIVIVVMSVVVPVAVKQPGAGEVHEEAEDRDRQGFAEGDGLRIAEARETLVAYGERDHGKDDGTGEGGQIPELGGAEGEARVVGMKTGEAIGQGGDTERRRVGRHVPAVGGEGHRAEDRPAHDLCHHHRQGQADDEDGPALVAGMRCPEEIVAVPPGLDAVAVHERGALKESSRRT